MTDHVFVQVTPRAVKRLLERIESIVKDLEDFYDDVSDVFGEDE